MLTYPHYIVLDDTRSYSYGHKFLEVWQTLVNSQWALEAFKANLLCKYILAALVILLSDGTQNWDRWYTKLQLQTQNLWSRHQRHPAVHLQY